MGSLVEGAFREQPTDPHVERRHALLGGGQSVPSPAVPTIQARADRFPDVGADALLNELGQRGLAVVQLDEPLANDRFVELGLLLGTAMAETDPAVQPYVENDVILNLVSEHDQTHDVSLQPFATNALTLHSESSGRPAVEQPGFIVLLCYEPGAASAAQTVLIPMAAVARGLTPMQRELLACTRYRRNQHGPCICREIEGRPVFSFRDFESQTLEWTYAGDCPSVDVNGAIRALLTAMYEPSVASGVHWARGKLVVIDNTFFFHGRTAGRATTATRTRHLKRLRILQGSGRT
jgi:hypothetical protein